MILFTLHRYRDLDLKLQKNKERLIDDMVKAIFLYDDRLEFYLSYQDEPISIPTTEELDTMESSSTLSAAGSPKITPPLWAVCHSDQLPEKALLSLMYRQKSLQSTKDSCGFFLISRKPSSFSGALQF